jgi:general secretion pathway protein I
MLRKCYQRGFTLLEVLVALAVITISLSAVIKVVSETTNTTIYLKEKTLAQWVASNKVVEYRMRRDWPAVGRSNGTATMGDVEWGWLVEVKDTPDPTVRRLEVSVKPATQKADDPTVFIVAFMGRPS